MLALKYETSSTSPAMACTARWSFKAATRLAVETVSMKLSCTEERQLRQCADGRGVGDVCHI
jgi:hypothetical protein